MYIRVLNVIGDKKKEAMDFNKRYRNMKFPKMLPLRGQDYNAEWVGCFYEAFEAEMKDIEKLCRAEVSSVPPEQLEMGKYGPQIAALDAEVSKSFASVLSGLDAKMSPIEKATLILQGVAEQMAEEAGKREPEAKDLS